jgi:putative ABC transport system substrate-binding protein
MQRRTFLAAMSGSLLAAPRIVTAQKPQKIARLGILGVGPAPSPEELARSVATNPFWQSMRQLGWVEGQTLIVERRFGESDGLLRAGAADLVRLKVDVLFVSGAGLAKMLQAETKTIPIVVGRAEGDLVAAGLVDSLAKPGSNITGAQILSDDLAPKRLELLSALIPKLSKVAFLQDDVTFSALPQMRARGDRAAANAAQRLGIELRTVVVHRAEELPAAFRGMRKHHDQAVMVSSSAFMFAHRKALADLAATHRIPAMYEVENFLESGGVMSYGVNVAEMQRRAAGYVDKILKGAKPADLPIEQPTKFDLVINVKTAKALGLTVPPSLLGRADQVIE